MLQHAFDSCLELTLETMLGMSLWEGVELTLFEMSDTMLVFIDIHRIY